MRKIELLQKRISSDCFSDTALYAVLGKQKYWNASRLVAKGELERVRAGLYVFGPDYRKRPLNLYSIANVLYGPSYVSLDSALSYHQFIPEQVIEVTSVNPKRTKNFDTAVGRFSYRKIPDKAFTVGLIHVEDSPSSFLIASKEKALLDKLYLDAARDAGLEYCCASLRIEESRLKELEMTEMIALAQTYGNKRFEKQVYSLISEL